MAGEKKYKIGFRLYAEVELTAEEIKDVARGYSTCIKNKYQNGEVNYPRPKGSELLVFASTELLVHCKHIASLAYRQLPQRRVVPTTQLDYGF